MPSLRVASRVANSLPEALSQRMSGWQVRALAAQAIADPDDVGGQVADGFGRGVDLRGQLQTLPVRVYQAERAAFQAGQGHRPLERVVQDGRQIQLGDGGREDLADGGQFAVSLADFFLGPVAFLAGPQRIDAIGQVVGQFGQQLRLFRVESVRLGGVNVQRPNTRPSTVNGRPTQAA